MRENCLEQFDEHWKCLENNNQVSTTTRLFTARITYSHSPLSTPGIFHVPQTRTDTKQMHVRETGSYTTCNIFVCTVEHVAIAGPHQDRYLEVQQARHQYTKFEKPIFKAIQK
jgi:hypothetical protein